MLLQVNYVEFYSHDCGVSSLPQSLIVHLHSKLPVTFRDYRQTATGPRGSCSGTHDPTHCSRDKHL